MLRFNPELLWMKRRDYPEVLDIDRVSFALPWGEDDLLTALRQKQTIGMVMVPHGYAVGFMVYSFLPDSIELLRFAVRPDRRREGVGERMAAALAGKLCGNKRTRVTLHVRETNMDALRFWRAQGYRATGVVREHYKDSGEDAYVMAYALGAEKPAVAAGAVGA